MVNNSFRYDGVCMCVSGSDWPWQAATIHIHHCHLLLLLLLSLWYSFCGPTKGGRLSRPRHCSKRACRLHNFISVAVVIITTAHGEIQTSSHSEDGSCMCDWPRWQPWREAASSQRTPTAGSSTTTSQVSPRRSAAVRVRLQIILQLISVRRFPDPQHFVHHFPVHQIPVPRLSLSVIHFQCPFKIWLTIVGSMGTFSRVMAQGRHMHDRALFCSAWTKCNRPMCHKWHNSGA